MYTSITVVDKESHKGRQGIHLLNPSARDIENAIETAERDLFRRIYVHVNTELLAKRASYQRYKTWCKSKDKGYRAFLDLAFDRYPMGASIDLSHVGFSPIFGGGYGVFKAGTQGKVETSGSNLVVIVGNEVFSIDLIGTPCGHDNLAQLEFNKYSKRVQS